MKRGVFDLLRRGFDNTIANWQVTALRVAELVVMIGVTIGAVIVIVIPILVSIGINTGNLASPDELEELVTTLATKWMLLLWIFLGVSALLLVWMLVHSFLEAGAARVFVDADRVAGPELRGTRSRYRVFSFERFLAGAKDGWWTVFWIYNLTWGVGLLIALVPLFLVLGGMFFLRGNEGAMALVGCFGLFIAVLVMIPIIILSAIWCTRAIIDWATRREGALESVQDALGAIKSDFGRHLLTAVAIFVVSFAASMFLSSLSMFASIGEAVSGNEGMVLAMTLPLRLAVSLVNSAFSTLIASWFVATYAAIATDPYR